MRRFSSTSTERTESNSEQMATYMEADATCAFCNTACKVSLRKYPKKRNCLMCFSLNDQTAARSRRIKGSSLLAMFVPSFSRLKRASHRVLPHPSKRRKIRTKSEFITSFHVRITNNKSHRYKFCCWQVENTDELITVNASTWRSMPFSAKENAKRLSTK